MCLLAAIGYEALPVYILICYVTAASNGYDFKFPWTLGKLDLSWLVDLPKWGRPQLQQHNRVLAVAQTVLRHSLGISLGECTSSWQESFTVDKFWSKSFVYSFTKTKGDITPREGMKTYQLVFPKPLTRPFVLKYVKLLGFANQASLPSPQVPWGVTHEWTPFVLPSGLPVVM